MPRGAGLLLCGLLSAAGHAALLLGATPSPDLAAAGHAPHTTGAAPAAVELRPAPAAATPPPAFAAVATNAPAPDLTAATDSSSPDPTEARPTARAIGSDSVLSKGAEVAEVAPAADPTDHYLPRSALDQGPAPTGVVDVPYPADAPAGRFEGVLTLFIDAGGRVQRVRHDSGNLPAQLADEARQAFLAATFSPGVKDGQAVGSRLRVAVTFGVDAPRADPTRAAAASDPR